MWLYFVAHCVEVLERHLRLVICVTCCLSPKADRLNILFRIYVFSDFVVNYEDGSFHYAYINFGRHIWHPPNCKSKLN